MSARQASSGCAVTALVAGVVLLLATLVGGGLLVMFWGVRTSETPPVTRDLRPEPPSRPTEVPPVPEEPEEPAPPEDR